MKNELKGYLSDRQFNKILGQNMGHIGESIAKRILKSEGFQVEWISIDPRLHYDDVGYGKHSEDLTTIIDFKKPTGLFRNRRVDSFYRELFKLMRATSKIETGNYNLGTKPDYLAKKGNKIYVIDVKTGNARLKHNQMVAFLIAKKHNLIPGVLNLQLDLRLLEVRFIEANDQNMNRLYPRKWKELTTPSETPQ